MRPLHVIIDYPCSEYILLLKKNRIIEMVHAGSDAAIARFGVNTKNLRKILNDYQRNKPNQEE